MRTAALLATPAFALVLAIGNAASPNRAFAEEAPEAPQATAGDVTSWGSLETAAANWHPQVAIVTSARPGKRTMCHLLAMRDDGVTCQRGLVGQKLEIPRKEIAAILLEDGRQPTWGRFFAFLGGGIALTAIGIALLPTSVGASLVLILAGGALVSISPAAAALGGHGSGERVLYQEPGSTLTVSLRG